MPSHPKFGSLSDETGLDVVDPIETRHFSLFTPEPVEPTVADPDSFAFPVGTACRIRTAEFRFPYMVPMEIRTPEGDHHASVDQPTVREFSADDYLLELHSPIKLYLRVTSGMAIDATDDSVEIEFDGAVPVVVGARSYHSSPAATITVPDDPEALMDAVTAFSSALKTTSPERAWPTLRGHPPRIERGDELVIPDDLDPPDTGVTIVVPPEYGYVYTVAPLAYYLGADVVAGETPQLRADSGVAEYLGDDVETVGESVESLLKRVFLFDCVVRTEGLYPDDLYERSVLESYVDLDFAALYDASISDRLSTALSIPDEAIAAIESPWHQVTHVQPEPDTAELLPYVIDDLSLVRAKVVSDEAWTPTESQQQTDDALDAFLRSPEHRWSGTRGNDGPMDESAEGAEHDPEAARGVPGEGGYMPLPETDALEQAWVGDRTPVEGTKLLREAFEHETTTSEDGTVEITVVCNDEEMREELDSATEIYGTRDDVRANVTSEFGVSTDELRELLAADNDMFHFIGHIDGLGFQCSDGILDAETLDSTGAETVLLNGCRSHDQGVALVKAGARAAVVSLADLWNSGAVEVGETLARLLHHGFGIGSAIEIVREYTSLGGQYVVLGDPSATSTYCENNTPVLYHVLESVDSPEEFESGTVEAHSYVTETFKAGSILQLYLSGVDEFYVAGGLSGRVTVSREGLHQTLKGDWPPLVVGGELLWSDSWLGEV